MPAELKNPAERVGFVDALGSTDTLPRMVVGVATDDGGVEGPRVWTTTASSGWSWLSLPAPTDQDTEVTFAVTDGTTTWFGGTFTAVGERRIPFVFSSPDRSHWTRVALPAGGGSSAFRPEDAVAVDGRLVLVGTTGDAMPAVLGTSQDAAVQQLPIDAAVDFGSFTGMAATGGTVVATASVGDDQQTIAYRSEDGGASWTRGHVDVGAGGGVTGVASTGETFVATGWRGGDVNTPAAWSSSDGSTWSAEAMPQLDPEVDSYAPGDGDSSWLGAPSSAAGRVVAPFVIDADLRIGAMERAPDGSWRVLGAVGNGRDPGVAGVGAVDSDGGYSLAQSADGYGRITRISPSGEWAGIVQEEGVAAPSLQAGEFSTGGALPELSTWSTQTELLGDGAWSMRPRSGWFSVGTDGAVVPSSQLPSAGAGVVEAVVTNDQGASVALGSSPVDSDADFTRLTGWYRSTPDAPWQEVVTPEPINRSELQSVAWVGSGWLAVGYVAPNRSTWNQAIAAAWTSPEGVNWSSVDGVFSAPDGGTSVAYGACATAGGSLVVGSEVSGEKEQKAAWRASGGTWTRVPTEELGAAPGYLGSCVSVGGTTLLTAQQDGRASVLSSPGAGPFATKLLD